MKKTILLGFLALAALSCSKQQTKPSAESIHKQQIFKQRTSPELENFRLALNQMNRPEYAPSREYMEKYGDELSDERKQILFEPGKALILSTGITERELVKETNNDRDKILNKAFKIYISQTSKK